MNAPLTHAGAPYRYIEDLLALDSYRPWSCNLPSPRFCEVVTPLDSNRWDEALRAHPDRAFASYITRGIQYGFRVGFQFGAVSCRSTHVNMPSASQCSDKIDEFFATECAAGRILGPFDRHQLPMVHINRLGAVPKSTPGTYRMIVDLSFPEGHSPNDGIRDTLCSLTYASVEDAAQSVLRLGRGTLMAKMDIRSAYRNVPVHPDDRWLLGMVWRQSVFIDTVLPFGLRSAPKIFNTLADGLEWTVRHDGVREMYHYLDDFLVLGAPGSNECETGLSKLLGWTRWLGFPIAEEKVEGPSSRITFLGIEIDSDALVLRLPPGKLQTLKERLSWWKDRRSCTKSDLQSLAGSLQHACRVVRPGRTFLRRVFELLRGVHRSHHHIRLNSGMRSDLAWWDLFLDTWNGVSLLRPSRLASPDHEFYTDASGSYGCGAIWGCRWIQLEWPQSYENTPIAPKEMVPIVMACILWGQAWQGQVIQVHSDNEAVVAVVNSGYSRDTQLMHLARCLFFALAAWDISLYARHIPGVLNTVADAISRDNLSLLFSKVPGAEPRPTAVPLDLLELLVTSQPDWTQPTWRRLFGNSLRLASRHPPRELTDRANDGTCSFAQCSASPHTQPPSSGWPHSLHTSTAKASVPPQ